MHGRAQVGQGFWCCMGISASRTQAPLLVRARTASGPPAPRQTALYSRNKKMQSRALMHLLAPGPRPPPRCTCARRPSAWPRAALRPAPATSSTARACAAVWTPRQRRAPPSSSPFWPATGGVPNHARVGVRARPACPRVMAAPQLHVRCWCADLIHSLPAPAALLPSHRSGEPRLSSSTFRTVNIVSRCAAGQYDCDGV